MTVSISELKTPLENLVLTVTVPQVEDLANSLELVKAIAAPNRLSILGFLAKEGSPVKLNTLAQYLNLAPQQIERDLHQLANIGLITILKWETTGPGREPFPELLALNFAYFRVVQQMIATLHKLNGQLKPKERRARLSKRGQTLERFMKDGRLLTWPTQFEKQVYVLEEVAKRFGENRLYSENEVNAILKSVYETDHCILRRQLVALKLLKRENGVYWKLDPSNSSKKGISLADS